jgi:hypothetical protein
MKVEIELSGTDAVIVVWRRKGHPLVYVPEIATTDLDEASCRTAGICKREGDDAAFFNLYVRVPMVTRVESP